MLKLRYLTAARKDLSDIGRWSQERFGTAQANAYLDKIDQALRLIAENPGLARDASETRTGLLKTFAGSHIAYFRMDERSITVQRILHGSMDAGRWM
jgi:toxin ParE1/3/4